jgi:hypothetical protein
MRLRSLWSAFKFLVLSLAGIIIAAILILSYAPNVARNSLAWLGEVSEFGSGILAPPLAAERESGNCFWMKQNWSNEDRAWMHNASQGTATFPMPYTWFQKLERPEFSPSGFFTSRPQISDAKYLERLGFIAPNKNCDPAPDTNAPEGYGVLPVGFAVLKGGLDPVTGARIDDGLGLTCAACHTGRVFYKGTELRIDGAPAMIDLGNLERVIGLSICYSDLMPWRKRRLVNALLDNRTDLTGDAREKEEAEIENQLKAICDEKIMGKVRAEKAILERRHQTHSEEGFGRLDALNRIGNQVFHENLIKPPNKDAAEADQRKEAADLALIESNFAAHTAPVSFPPIWDVPNFAWAQYDASILNPGVRNIGEAIGVTARVNMISSDNPSLPLFSSSVDVEAIRKIEELLQGKKTPFEGEIGFKGLQAPRWEDAASHFPDDENWKIDEEKIVAGRKLYLGLCVECHDSPPRDNTIPEANSFWNLTNNWIQVRNEQLFNNKLKTVAAMGTDPEQSRVLTERTVNLPSYLGVDTAALMKDCGMKPDAALERSYALNLMDVVAKVRDQWIIDRERLDGKPMSEADKAAIVGSRPNCPNPKVFELIPVSAEGASDQKPRFVYKIKPQYRARPLDGVWATAPYLHNGSVPTLDDLLSPQDERPKAFCVGPAEFDPTRVGLAVATSSSIKTLECEVGMTRFDVTERGNSNRGHSFEGDGKNMPNGVIGPLLSAKDRENLIAYLKTL